MKKMLFILLFIPLNLYSQCFFDWIYTNTGPCETGSTFEVDGEFSFINNPGSGSITVELTNASGTTSQTINPPFVDGQLYLFSLFADADSSPATLTIFFTADPTCSISQSLTSPVNCDCDAEIGTFSVASNGNINGNDITLCYDDYLDITTNGDWTAPDELFAPPGPVYDPGITWLVYSCPPSIGLIPDPVLGISSDPCFVGVVSDFDLNEINDQFWLNTYPGTFTDNKVYFLPITMYSISSATYSYVNTSMPCYQTGPAYGVTYLDEVQVSEVQNPGAQTVTISISGGTPALDGSNFTISNVQPASAVVSQTTVSNNGSFTISNLTCANNYSYTVTDDTGCSYIFGSSISSVQTVSACDSYTWIDGNTYTANNNSASFMLTNAAGCDSLVTLNLSINSNTGIDSVSVCDSYTWIDGNTYTSNNNTATFTLTNAAGCDSVVSLNLTVNSNTGTDFITSCDSLTWIDGITYIANNNSATYVLTNVEGCDSLVTLDLTINESSSSNLTETALDTYTLNGQTYNQSGIYSQTLSNSLGCDSIITLDLTLSHTGLPEVESIMSIYPNPTSNIVYVKSTAPLSGGLSIYDTRGRLVLREEFLSNDLIDVSNINKGMYYLKFDQNQSPVKFIKE